jgi:transposase
MQGIQMPKSRSDSSNTQVTPNPELEKLTRRRFPAAYKLSIIAEADACKHGELGGIMRRENAT